MTSKSFKSLMKPFGTVFRLKRQHILIRFHSAFFCGEIPNRKPETSVRLFSGSSNPNIISSCYPTIDLPEMPFHEFIFEQIGRWEDKVAMECGATGKKLKYKELFKQSRVLASSLQKKFQMKKGDVQAVILPNCPEYAAAFLAGSMTGVVSTTVNPIYTATEISLQLKMAQPKVLITTPEAYVKCSDALKLINVNIPIVVVKDHPEAEIPSGGVSYAELTESSTPAELEPVNVDVGDDLVIPFSSGTSGLPKGVLLTHRNITGNLFQFASGNRLKSNPNKETNQSIILGILPMFHIYGMVIVTFDALRCGAQLVTLPKFEPKSFLETISSKKTEILYLAPPLVFFLANHPVVDRQRLKYVQHVVSGAAPCGVSDIDKLFKKCPDLKMSQGYGMTETSPVVTMSHYERFHKTSSVGHPLSLTQIKITDVNTGEPLPKGSHGEICVKGPQVMKGYLNNLQETKNTFDEEGWLKTGDIGYYDDEHDFYVVDRLKELIKVKGFQVAPAELEEMLRSHPKIADSGVTGVPHPDLGEAPRAFVVIKEGFSMTETEIQDFIKETLAPYKQLKGGVRIVKEIPKSSAGKILRKDLKKLDNNSR